MSLPFPECTDCRGYVIEGTLALAARSLKSRCRCSDREAERAKIEAIKARHPRWEYIRFEYGRWTSTHENYDCSWEGEEDGWVSNNLMAEGRTLDELEEDMADIEAEHPEFAA